MGRGLASRAERNSPSCRRGALEEGREAQGRRVTRESKLRPSSDAHLRSRGVTPDQLTATEMFANPHCLRGDSLPRAIWSDLEGRSRRRFRVGRLQPGSATPPHQCCSHARASRTVKSTPGSAGREASGAASSRALAGMRVALEWRVITGRDHEREDTERPVGSRSGGRA